ncbi:PEPxxWA-CTERM sorting domain-containing protein [Sphingomonas sp. JC676]|uniref:PEPxxWA-CTERM sorting domain-containing protein n=1 Tax=Sphingomonas sp. JC676 TaxID=2768065 RepID=UPI00165835BB|nr:PEPxxWA-CTERM sorting domain-containing protein [Sphingomonas sp. JC676]MBC9031896.1 PEPxxWA-CTERM sorting domain-containing protein [Sphingomonas sp. JC676]
MRSLGLKFVATLALITPAVASAQGHYVVYGPTVDVFAAASAHQGPNVAGSAIHQVNGNVIDSWTSGGGGNAHTPNGTIDGSVYAYQNGGNGNVSLYSEAGASASLAQGKLHGYVGATGPNNFGSPAGFSESRIADTVYFNNTTGGDLSLSLFMSFDGHITDVNGDANPGGSVRLALSGCGSCGNIRFANSGTGVGDVISGLFDEAGTYMFTTQATGAVPLGQSDRWFTALGAGDGNGGVDGWMGTTLLIPTGESSLGIGSYLGLDCRGGSICDFGHTSLFRFDALPNGLSWTSESGVFLTDIGAGNPGGVPEPAAWGMMIGGFAFAGGMLRRRKVVTALA